METNTTLDVHNDASSTITDHSANVSYDNTIEANAGVSVGNDNASIGVDVSIKTGTIASAEAGLNGNNIEASVNYSDTTEAHVTVEGNVDYHGVGGSVTGDAYAKSGNEAEAHISAGENGLDVGAGVSCGSAVGVDGEGTVDMREASATGGAGVSIGEHFEAGGSAQATFKDGEATVGVSGDIAAIVGLEVDTSVTIDTNQIQKDSKLVIRETTKIVDKVVNETKPVVNTVVNETKPVVNTVVNETKPVVNTVVKETTKVTNTVVDETKKTTKTISDHIKKIFKW